MPTLVSGSFRRRSRKDSKQECAARVARACAEIGELWKQLRGEANAARSNWTLEFFFIFQHRRVRFQPTGHRQHVAAAARPDVYDAMLHVAAALGQEGLAALNAFFAITSRAGPPVLEGFYRRQVALGLQRAGAISEPEAREILGSSTEDSSAMRLQNV